MPWSTFSKPGKPLARMSEKTLAKREAWDACCREVRRRSGGKCEGAPRVPHVRCWGPKDVHHILTRARGRRGDDTDPDNCMLLCRRHHDWAHFEARGEEAYEAGLLRHSWDRP